MKIAYISAGNLPSEKANTIQVMKVCQAFTRLGHEVILFVPSSGASDPSWEFLSHHYGISTPFKIQYFKMDPLFKRRSISWKGIRLAIRLNVDMVYARAIPPAVLALLFKIPVVLEMHQLPSGRFGPFWYQLFLKVSGKKLLVPITDALKKSLSEKFTPALPEQSVVVAPSGVDLDRYKDLPDPVSARRMLELPDQFTVVCSGHLYRGRGMKLVTALAGELPDMNFLWVGGTDKEVERWRKEVESNGVKNLSFIGFIPNQQLPLYQAASNALLIPYEVGFTNSGGENISAVSSPMKIFEYMAAYRPILSSDLPVLHEVLNENNAIFCPVGDVSAWKKALLELQDDPGRGSELAAQARIDVEKYGWEERCRMILEAFNRGVS
jgi:glycosyltransferase involved in cell wall biosynthesis